MASESESEFGFVSVLLLVVLVYFYIAYTFFLFLSASVCLSADDRVQGITIHDGRKTTFVRLCAAGVVVDARRGWSLVGWAPSRSSLRSQ